MSVAAVILICDPKVVTALDVASGPAREALLPSRKTTTDTGRQVKRT